MTTRWMATGLAVLALAACHKKDEAKPPPPKPDAPPTTSTTTTPATAETPPVTPPPAVTTPDAPPTITSTYIATPPPIATDKTGKATREPAERRPPVTKVIKTKPVAKVVKTKAELAAQSRIVGKWIQQKNRKSVLTFTADGRVRSVDDPKFVWSGDWEAQPDGSVKFDLSLEGSAASKDPDRAIKITAYPTAAKIMAIVPHWGKNLPGSGQYAYERQ